MTLIRIKEVVPLPKHRLRLTLSDGAVIERDIGKYLVGPVFESVRSDPGVFAHARASSTARSSGRGTWICVLTC